MIGKIKSQWSLWSCNLIGLTEYLEAWPNMLAMIEIIKMSSSEWNVVEILHAFYKCLHGFAPRYLSDYCFPVQVSSTRSSLRSARFQECLLVVPRTKTKTIGPRGFFHASPTVWNSLPDDLCDPELSIGCFKNKLKTFLFSKSNANVN